MVNRLMALALSAALASQGCAAATMGSARGAQPPMDVSVMSDYVQRLPPGAAIKIERTGGRTLRGTLMKATDRSVVVQPRTRIAEPAMEIGIDELLSVTPDVPQGSNVGKAIGIGAAAGAGAALALFLIIVAAYAD